MKFEMWSIWHFLYLLSPFVIFFAFYFLLRNKSDKVKNIVGYVLGGISVSILIIRMAPVTTFMLSLVAWAVVPFDYGMVLSDSNIGLLYLFAISSLGVYGIIIAGWSSN